MVLRVAVFSSVQNGLLGGTGGPVAGHPFAAGVGGMECYGRSQAGSIKIDRPRRGGGQTQSDLAPGCAGLGPHTVGARQRM
jgi:hypothetical protein